MFVIDYNNYINYTAYYIDGEAAKNGTREERNLKKTMRDLKEEKLKQQLQALAQQGDWDGVVQALDDYDKNNDRRYEDHRDDFDLSCLNGGISADGHYQIPESLKLYEEDDWLDIIFSQEAEDLPNLVAEYPVSGAMRELTSQQQEILRLNIVFGIPTKDIAKQMGCTTRNITKQRQKALEKIRFLVTGQRKPEDI